MGQTLCRPLVRHRRGQRGWLSTGTAPFFLSLTQGGRYRAVTPKVFPAVMPTDSCFSASDTSAKNGSTPRAPATSFDSAVMMSIKRLDNFHTLHGFDENTAAAAAAAMTAASGSPYGSGIYEEAGEQMLAPVLSFRYPSRPSTAVLAGAAVPSCIPSAAGFAYSGNRFNGSSLRRPPAGSLSSDKPSAAFLSNALASRWSALKVDKAVAAATKRQQDNLLLAVRPLRRAE